MEEAETGEEKSDFGVERCLLIENGGPNGPLFFIWVQMGGPRMDLKEVRWASI